MAQIVILGGGSFPTCDKEKVIPNLKIAVKTNLNGTVLDPSLAPLKDTSVRLVDDGRLVRTVSTDKSGAFDLGDIRVGKYRLLVGGREWLQPNDFFCSVKRCSLSFILKLKPTDSDVFASCPVK